MTSEPRQNSTLEIDDATRAWDVFVEGIVVAPLANTSLQAGSPSGG